MSRDLLYPLRVVHGRFHEWQLYRKDRKKIKTYYIEKIKDMLSENPNSVVLVFTPEHENIGDHAIAYSEIKMLIEADVDYIEVTGFELEKLKKYKLLNVFNGYKILFQGGGYLGTLWFDSELLVRDIIQNNPRSDILMLPNTIFYEDNEWGKTEFENSKKIYNNHKNLMNIFLMVF